MRNYQNVNDVERAREVCDKRASVTCYVAVTFRDMAGKRDRDVARVLMFPLDHHHEVANYERRICSQFSACIKNGI